MDLDIDGTTYRTGRLTPKQQLHVLRRLAPVLAGSAGLITQPNVQAPPDAEGNTQGLSTEQMIQAFQPFAVAIAGLPDDTVDYMVDTCLATCQRNTGTSANARWTNLMLGTSLMFQDITMPTMLRLCFETVRENLAGFFPAAPGS